MTYRITARKTLNKLYDGLSSYYPKVKLILGTNPLIFMDTKIINNNGMIETWVPRKKTKQTEKHHRHLTFLNGIKGIPLKQNYIEQSTFHQSLQMR